MSEMVGDSDDACAACLRPIAFIDSNSPVMHDLAESSATCRCGYVIRSSTECTLGL